MIFKPDEIARWSFGTALSGLGFLCLRRIGLDGTETAEGRIVDLLHRYINRQ